MGLESISEMWPTWFFVAASVAGLMQFIGKNKKPDIQPGMATKSDHFSMKTVFFSFRSGEAPLFFMVIIITVSFFLFSLGIAKDIGALFPQ